MLACGVLFAGCPQPEAGGLVASPSSGTTTEAGGQASFAVALELQPSAGVTLSVGSTDTSEGTVSPATLTFTRDDWNAPQSVTVTGVDDAEQDGPQEYAVTFEFDSEDPAYSGLAMTQVDLVNTDDETAGVTLGQPSGSTSEAGGQASFTVVLDSQPASSVELTLESGDVSEGTIQPTSLTFTPDDWNAPQEVLVTGVDDDLADGAVEYEVLISGVVSNDPNYAALSPAGVTFSNTDDDSAGITVSAISGPTTEAGAEASFTVVLNSEPAADVTVAFDSDDASEGTVDPTSLTFTPIDWASPQAVTVTGVDDDVADGDQLYEIVFVPTTSNDEAYAAITPANVAVTNNDDDLFELSFTDTSSDDLTSDAVESYFSEASSSISSTHYLFFEVAGGPSPGALCVENAKWYADEYLAYAGSDSSSTSGSWEKWTRIAADGAWGGPTTNGFTNYWGTGCSGNSFDWCAEWGITTGSGSLNLGIMPGRPSLESYANGWPDFSAGSHFVTLRIASSREGACGF